MNPALTGSSAIWHFEGSNLIEICDGITFDFYTGLPHIQSKRIFGVPWSISQSLLLNGK